VGSNLVKRNEEGRKSLTWFVMKNANYDIDYFSGMIQLYFIKGLWLILLQTKCCRSRRALANT
jgi:hypothetical protein